MLTRSKKRKHLFLVAGICWTIILAGGNESFAEEQSKLKIQKISLSHPTPATRYYHLKASLKWSGEDKVKIKRVTVNGENPPIILVAPIERFALHISGKRVPAGSFISPGEEISVVAMVNWQAKKRYKIRIEAVDKKKNTFIDEKEISAPLSGGYYNPAWKYYKAIALLEEQGIAREKEPVDLRLAFLAGRITNLKKELRVVEVDPVTGQHQEIPHQIYNEKLWNQPNIARYAPVRFCNVVFLADVPANSAKVYLVFYGNAKAEFPVYKTDLKITGAGLGLSVENSHYQVKLGKGNGQLSSLVIKAGSKRKLTFGSGPIHWNPGGAVTVGKSYTWISTRKWNPPEGQSILKGPVFCQVRRWGYIHEKKVYATVVYRFYAHQPYVIMSSIVGTREETAFVNMRNDELAFKNECFSRAAWRTRGGEIKKISLKQSNPALLKGYVAKLAPDLPWVSFYNPQTKDGCASIRLQYYNYSEGKAEPIEYYPHTFILSHGEGIYWVRGTVFGYWGQRDFGGERIMVNPVNPVPAGCRFLEKNAYLVYAYNAKNEFSLLKKYETSLKKPLRIERD